MRSRTGGWRSSPRAPTGTRTPRPSAETREQQATLERLLADARELGFVAGESASAHLAHALRFGEGIAPPALAVDLGSGAGLPGLPLALHWPASRWVLVDSNARRAAFLRGAVPALGLGDRVEVAQERAERLGRDPALRGMADLVVARSFGPPAVVAECAAPLLRVGGLLVVSEPPEGREWPEAGLAQLNLAPRSSPGSHQVLEQVGPCPERFPRRVPSKRPLFDVSRGTRDA